MLERQSMSRMNAGGEICDFSISIVICLSIVKLKEMKK